MNLVIDRISRRSDARLPAVVGREARLDLVFERRGGHTVLAHAYAEPPFRIGSVLSLDGAAYVIVVCCGPGIFAGDTLHQTLRVARGAQVVVTSQAALQVHPSSAEIPARIVHEYDVEADAELYAHWDPVIPFADARVEQRFDLRVADTSRVYWSDALMSGRAARGEAWRFSALAHELRLSAASSLKYLERYRLTPGARRIVGPWAAGPANYLATALVHDTRGSAVHAETLQGRLARLAGLRVGVDAVEPGLIVARLAAVTGPPFAAARALLRQLALEVIFGRPNLVGRK